MTGLVVHIEQTHSAFAAEIEHFEVHKTDVQGSANRILDCCSTKLAHMLQLERSWWMGWRGGVCGFFCITKRVRTKLSHCYHTQHDKRSLGRADGLDKRNTKALINPRRHHILIVFELAIKDCISKVRAPLFRGSVTSSALITCYYFSCLSTTHVRRETL